MDREKIIKIAMSFLLILTILGCSSIGVFNFLVIKNMEIPDERTTGTGKSSGSLMNDVTEHDFDVTYPNGMLEKYNKLYALNDDVVGWIKIPGTSIDTVVLQGSNNSYYLKNDFYCNYTRYGNIYMDYRANEKSLIQNNVLYGHTTESGEQAFFDLDKYKNSDFFIESPIIEFDTLFADYKWKVFAVFMTSVDSSDDNGHVFYYIEPHINKTSFDGYLKQVNQRALYSTGVDVTSEDKILTLSTCTYDFGDDINTRLVVVARLLRKDESRAIDQSKVKKKADYRRPQAWYDKYGLTNPYSKAANWKSATNG